jgi:RNA polymerase sigma factor (TIGR02999 family)
MNETTIGPDVTDLLLAWRRGDDSAETRLLQVTYPELRRIAEAHLSRERRDVSLQVTEIVNEAYLRLVSCRTLDWRDRTHFFAMCARLIRRALVDHARRKGAGKRGARPTRVELVDTVLVERPATVDVLDLEQALESLARIDERAVQVVVLRYFGGLTVSETAEVLRLGTTTVVEDWAHARAWLRRRLEGARAR